MWKELLGLKTSLVSYFKYCDFGVGRSIRVKKGCGFRNIRIRVDVGQGLQCVAEYPDGTSIRTLKTKTQFFWRPFQLSVKEVFRMKAEHFSFKIKVLAS